MASSLFMASLKAVNPENGTVLASSSYRESEDAGAAFVLESKGTHKSNLSFLSILFL